jgi:hypothetical protein
MTPRRFALAAALCAALAPTPSLAQAPAASSGPLKIETIGTIGGADLLRDQLRGVSGSIAVRLGGH